MLNTINKIYLLVSILLYILLSPKEYGEYFFVTIFSICTFISYYFILSMNMNIKFYTKTYLLIEIFAYSLLFITIANLISYSYHNNFFIFSESDAVFYHFQTLSILTMSFENAMEHYLSYMSFDDLGMILILYPLYHIVESNLILNLLYLCVGMITGVSLFRISKNFMTTKYAFLSASAYCLSSFVLFFHATGLKESFMIMLVVLSFDYYYRLNQSISSLIGFPLTLIGLLLFRPAISVMIVTAIGVGLLVSKKKGIAVKVISFFIFIFLAIMGDFIIKGIDTYTAGGIDGLLYARETQGMIIGGLPFTYMVNILSQSVGPIPTLISHEKILTMFYAPGLIYRVLLAFPFWFGVVYIYKNKYSKLYPLVLFVMMEMASLVFLIDGLELRKAMPHIPFVFIIAFWFLDNYDNKNIVIKRKKRFKAFFQLSILLLVLIIFYWNFR